MTSDARGVRFESGDKAFTAVFGMTALKATEAHYDLPFMEALQSVMPAVAAEDAKNKAKVEAASRKVRISEIARLFGFSLLKHHGDLNERDVDSLIDDLGLERVASILVEAVMMALPKEAGDDAATDPPTSASPKR